VALGGMVLPNGSRLAEALKAAWSETRQR